MKETIQEAVASPDAAVFQGEAQMVGEVQPKNNNVIKFIYSMNHILSEEQIKDFLDFAKIEYDEINIIPIMENNKKVSVNVIVYNNNILVCQIVSLHDIDINLQNKLAQIPSDKQVDYIIDLADTIVDTIQYTFGNIDYFYYAGQSTMAMYLNLKVNGRFNNVNCIESTTDRISVDKPDGTKVSVSKHRIWRNIFLLPVVQIGLN